MDSPSQRHPRPSSLRARSVRRHLPFVAFLAAFTVYCAYLQFSLTDVLNRLYLVRIFFQVAIAAVVIASIRNLVGVRTLGMFASVIIALAFLATGLVLGLAVFGFILGVVLVARGALVRERVQEAHRVAILVTIVSVTISSIAIVGLEAGQHNLFFAVLFPVLISAWMAERYVEQVVRVGWDKPTAALIWTLVAIVVSFVVITQDPLVNFVMLNPLTWVLLVLINWFLGTRVRFRLSERFRFGGVSGHAMSDGPIRGDFGDDILTMNVRNREFVAKYNPSETMGKLGKDEAKRILIPLGIPMAKTYGILRTRADVAAMRPWMATHDRFVLKPASGHGGEGILQLGAVAAAVRLSTGTIVHCVWRGQPQPNHPDTDGALLGKAVPSWDEILVIAAEAQRLSGLGFAGVDISLDARNGPVVMEVNRRPGLEIQNANAAGLLRRLRMIEALRDGNVSLEERLLIVRQFDKDHWGLRPSRPAPPTSPASEPT